MPRLLKPTDIARRKPFVRHKTIGCAKTISLKASVALASLPMTYSHTIAQEIGAPSFKERLVESLHSTEILMLAVFGGAMSFALMSATWLIRERNKVTVENLQLKDSLSNLRAENDRNEALIGVSDQCIIVWNGTEETPIILGQLSSPEKKLENGNNLLKFDDWLKPESSNTLEPILHELRINATPFDTTIETKTGSILEAQGRVTGSFAFMRIREVGSEREDYARIKIDHDHHYRPRHCPTGPEKIVIKNSANIHPVVAKVIDLDSDYSADWHLFEA